MQRRPFLGSAAAAGIAASAGDPAKAAALKGVPALVLYGDFIAGDVRWPAIRANGARFAEAVRAAGGTVDVVDLPERGIRGNSHMAMMDRNSDQVAGLVQDWLAAKGLRNRRRARPRAATAGARARLRRHRCPPGWPP